MAIQRNWRHSFKIAVPLAVTVLLPAFAGAGGFALLEQSAQGTGLGYAGATAGYDDGSAVFFNPGAMSIHEEATVSAGVSMISPNAKFSNEGSITNPAVGGAPLSGDNGPNGGVLAWVPSFYAVQPLSDGFSAGLGWNVPFGLSTNYSDDWVGRYSAIKTDLFTMTLSPAVSYKVNDCFSIGAAVNVMYADAELTNAVDFGTIGLAKLGLPTASGLGLLPQMADGFARVKGDDWGVGATAGMVFTYTEGSRIGLSYRSQIDTTLRGDATFNVPENAKILTSTGAFVDTHATADLTVPDSISAGWVHQISPEWSLLADAQWTRWSHFNELRVNFSSVQPDSVVDESWDDVWRFSVGAEYRPITPLKLHAGFTYDEEPIPNKYHRTPRIPGNDRYWMAFGASYSFTDALRADVAYAHLFVPEADMEIAGSTGDLLVGSWDLSIDIVSAQLTYAF